MQQRAASPRLQTPTRCGCVPRHSKACVPAAPCLPPLHGLLAGTLTQPKHSVPLSQDKRPPRHSSERLAAALPILEQRRPAKDALAADREHAPLRERGPPQGDLEEQQQQGGYTDLREFLSRKKRGRGGGAGGGADEEESARQPKSRSASRVRE